MLLGGNLGGACDIRAFSATGASSQANSCSRNNGNRDRCELPHFLHLSFLAVSLPPISPRPVGVGGFARSGRASSACSAAFFCRLLDRFGCFTDERIEHAYGQHISSLAWSRALRSSPSACAKAFLFSQNDNQPNDYRQQRYERHRYCRRAT